MFLSNKIQTNATFFFNLPLKYLHFDKETKKF